MDATPSTSAGQRLATYRFAPSPNGYLHLGHAYSALLNGALARAAGGRFLLRLEDIDLARCRPAYAEAIEADLGWLGLAWERPVRRQSEHLDLYRSVLTGLAERALAFPCFCTRGAIATAVAATAVASRGRHWPRDPDGSPLYPGTCRHLAPDERRRRLDAGERATWRLDMEAALATLPGALEWEEVGPDGPRRVVARPERWGDAVVGRRDVPTSYHVSVVIDDAAQGVTDVVRGTDLFEATALHRLLQALLGLPAPRYRHHRLILDGAGRKLSKSRDSPTLRDLRAAGTEAGDVRRQLGF